MKTVYLTQKFAGKTSQEIREERALLLEAAKNFLGEDDLEVERASKEVADFLLHGAHENLRALFAPGGTASVFWVEEKKGVPVELLKHFEPKINNQRFNLKRRKR